MRTNFRMSCSECLPPPPRDRLSHRYLTRHFSYSFSYVLHGFCGVGRDAATDRRVKGPRLHLQEHIPLGRTCALCQDLARASAYAKFSKCEVWISEVKFLGHVVSCIITQT